MFSSFRQLHSKPVYIKCSSLRTSVRCNSPFISFIKTIFGSSYLIFVDFHAALEVVADFWSQMYETFIPIGKNTKLLEVDVCLNGDLLHI